jgi:membrane protease YdiL (CAAX protease family)
MKIEATKQGAWLDLLLVIATAVLVKQAVYLVAWKFAGPASMVSAFLVASALLYRRGQTWRELGLCWPKSKRGLLFLPLQILLAFIAVVALSLFAAEVIAPLIPKLETSEDRFEGLYQNLPYFLLWLTIAVVQGGILEEAIYRGFLISRLRDALGTSGLATLASVLLPAVFFGLRHAYYQGWFGALATGLMALIFGLLYLMFRRNLAALIIAHAMADVIGMTLRYTTAPN